VTEPANGGSVQSSPILGRAVRATVVLALAGTLGQVFTLLRELFVASQVGISVDLDALLVATVVPMMVASLLSAGLASAIVPAYTAAVERQGAPIADRLLGATLTWTIITGLVAMVVVVLGAPVAVAVAGPGLDTESQGVATDFVAIVAPLVVLLATGSIMASVFQIHDRMRMIGSAWIIGPLVSLVMTVGLWSTLHLTALALAMVAQQLTVVLILMVIAIRLGIFPSPSLRADPDQAKALIRHALPLTVSSSVLTLNLLTDRAVATLITPGGVSALRYAEGVIRIPMNAILPAWSMTIYPTLVRASHLGGSGLGDAASNAMRYVIVLFVPLAVGTAALAPLVVNVAYARGAFDERASLLTAGALAAFAPLLFLTMANSILTGSHNARRRGVFLMSMGILNAILNAVFNIGFGLLIGVAGIALSTSLTVGFVQFIKAWRLGELDEAFPAARLLGISARCLVASAVVAVPIALISWTRPAGLALPVALALLVALSAAGMVGYIATARIVGLVEPWIVARALLRAPGRFARGRR
jgi:putative peptidoglycan lipid II flippase